MLNLSNIMSLAGVLMQSVGNPELASECDHVMRECAAAIERGKRIEATLDRIAQALGLDAGAALPANGPDAGRSAIDPGHAGGLRGAGPGPVDARGHGAGAVPAVLVRGGGERTNGHDIGRG